MDSSCTALQMHSTSPPRQLTLPPVKENLIRGELRNKEVRRREDVLSRNSLLTDLMHQGELATAYTVNQSHPMPNLRLSSLQALLQPFPLPMYLYMSASQSAATISNLNSLTLNLGQPA